MSDVKKVVLLLELSRQIDRDLAKGISTYAQFELGPGSNPDNAIIIFEEWEKLTNLL